MKEQQKINLKLWRSLYVKSRRR
uniref:Uncharacterized protein n=1 Tax=Anguilla anguilla TaxID=7936 RepID=A0A0E9S6I1_ANGAN